MCTSEDIMDDARANEWHDSGHDGGPEESCSFCQRDIEERAAYYRPSRAERQAAEYVTVRDGWVAEWETSDAARG